MRVSDRGACGVHDTWQINYFSFDPLKAATVGAGNGDRWMRIPGEREDLDGGGRGAEVAGGSAGV